MSMRQFSLMTMFMGIALVGVNCAQPLRFVEGPFKLSVKELYVPEGGGAVIRVALVERPAQTVTASVGLSGDPDLSLAGSMVSLTFTPRNFGIPQSVRVAAREDRDSDRGFGFVSMELGDFKGDNPNLAVLRVNELENDDDQRASGLYRGVPLSADSAGAALSAFIGAGDPGCAPLDPPLTYAAGDEITRVQGLELETGRRILAPVLSGPGMGAAAEVAITAQVLDTSEGYVQAVFLDHNAVPVDVLCSDPLLPGEAWELAATPGTDVAAAAVTAILYSMPYVPGQPDDPATLCDQASLNLIGDAAAFALFDQAFAKSVEKETSPTGPHITAVVRRVPGGQDTDSAGLVSATYNGLSNPMHGSSDFAAPYATTMLDLDTVLHLYNDSSTTANVSISFIDSTTQGTSATGAVVGPRSSALVNTRSVAGADFLGGARIQSDQPIAVVVDVVGAGPVAATYLATRADAGANQLVAPFLIEPGWTPVLAAYNLGSVSAGMSLILNNKNGGAFSSSSGPVQVGQTKFLEGQIGSYAATKPGMAELLSSTAPAAGVLVSLRRDQDSGDVTGLTIANLTNRDTVIDAPARAISGGSVKVIGLPLAGKEAHEAGLATEVIVHNANPQPGETAFALYIYDGGIVREYCAGTLRQRRSQLIPIDFGELSDGFRGPLLVAATASNQNGGPALIATAIQRARAVGYAAP